jgi:hypothetical protein
MLRKFATAAALAVTVGCTSTQEQSGIDIAEVQRLQVQQPVQQPVNGYYRAALDELCTLGAIYVRKSGLARDQGYSIEAVSEHLRSLEEWKG